MNRKDLHRYIVIAAVLVSTFFGTTTPAAAYGGDEPFLTKGTFYYTPFVGWHTFGGERSKDWFDWGMRIGYNVTEHLSLEGSGGFIETNDRMASTMGAYVLFNFPVVYDRAMFYLRAGARGDTVTQIDDVQYGIASGGGAKIMISPGFLQRFDLTVVSFDNTEDTIITSGFEILLGEPHGSKTRKKAVVAAETTQKAAPKVSCQKSTLVNGIFDQQGCLKSATLPIRFNTSGTKAIRQKIRREYNYLRQVALFMKKNPDFTAEFQSKSIRRGSRAQQMRRAQIQTLELSNYFSRKFNIPAHRIKTGIGSDLPPNTTRVVFTKTEKAKSTSKAK